MSSPSAPHELILPPEQILHLLGDLPDLPDLILVLSVQGSGLQDEGAYLVQDFLSSSTDSATILHNFNL